MSIEEKDLWETCKACGGYGGVSYSDHHPECKGDCKMCPIEINMEAGCHECNGRGGWKKPTLQVIKEAKEKAKNGE